MDAKLIHGGGHARMMDYTPSGSAVAGGDVVVVGDLPLVAHRDIVVGEQGALAAGGAVYELTAGEAIAAGKKVYWKAATSKVTETAADGNIFGYVEADSSAAADGDTIRVLHMPEKSDA